MSDFTDGVTAPVAPVGPTTEDYLANFVGEGKQYGTVEEAAKALAKKAVNADTFIETLKTEKQQLEERYNELQTRNRSIDEIVAAMKEEPKPQVAEPAAQSPLNVDEIIAQIEQRRKLGEEEVSRKNAVDSVWEKLSKEFGDLEKAKIVVSSYINNNDSRKKVIDTLALADPDSLVAILKKGGGTPVTFTEDSNSTSSNNDRPPVGTLTWDVVNKVRKENPKLYNSHAFKQRMHTELPKT